MDAYYRTVANVWFCRLLRLPGQGPLDDWAGFVRQGSNAAARKGCTVTQGLGAPGMILVYFQKILQNRNSSTFVCI